MKDAASSPNPLIFVIFGATGDLSRTKLFPALFDLYEKSLLPKDFQIAAVSRRDYSDDDFRNFLSAEVFDERPGDKGKKSRFLDHIFYVPGVFEDKHLYKEISDRLKKVDDSVFKKCSDKLFYLSVQPVHYEIIVENLASSGLTIPCGGDRGWTRILVEKPFGEDVFTAQKLDNLLHSLFKEEQIFRIDHYLAKEVLQNILIFRFANSFLEPIWDNEDIEKVEIVMHESNTARGRGAFYDATGTLRDVGQNHILQMLALVAMESPRGLDSGAVRKERGKVLSSLRPFSAKEPGTVRAQYKGYRDETGVSPNSDTETFFRVAAYVDNSRWKGVPFVLESGKGLHEQKAEIRIYFNIHKGHICPDGEDCDHNNVLTFKIQPDGGISILFWVKHPGLTTKLHPQELSFQYKESHDNVIMPDAYEKVLYDCIQGDQTLFTSTEEVEAAWKYIMSVIEGWKDVPLVEYDIGSKAEDVK